MESSSLEPVSLTSPLAAWVGGKRLLADQVCERLYRIPHKSYIEPFIGMGGIFFRRGFKPTCEVINDRNGELVNLFRVLQHHYLPFVEMMRWQLASRNEFKRLTDTDPVTLTDLQRAARFLYLQRLTFGGKVAGQSFGVSPGEGSAFNIARLEPLLSDVHERLAAVTIECLDFEDLIARYDGPSALFYCDPPYWGSEKVYGADLFRRADHARLAGALTAAEGRFVLSINDVAEIRRMYEDCAIEELVTTYTVSKGDASRVSELLITNAGDISGGLL